MPTIIMIFFAVLVPLVVLDALWLSTMNKFFYAKQLGSLLAKKPVWAAIVVFYILYAAGITFFVVAPSVGFYLPWWNALVRGIFFGVIAYATYDLTNQATVAGWPVAVTVVDMAWGGVLTGVVSVIAFLIIK